MQHERSNSGSKVWREWHEQRRQARETAMSSDEFGPVETEAYDLDTADIEGDTNPESFEVETRTGDTVDYRDIDPVHG